MSRLRIGGMVFRRNVVRACLAMEMFGAKQARCQPD
jgi:hypothetical protein